MIDPASFKIRFPEFIATDNARIQLFIDDSVLILNPSYWGEKYDMGLSYHAAHLLSAATRSEAGSFLPINPVNNKSVDGVSVGYATPAASTESDAFLASTQYGQRYLALRKTLGVPAFAI